MIKNRKQETGQLCGSHLNMGNFPDRTQQKVLKKTPVLVPKAERLRGLRVDRGVCHHVETDVKT